MKAVRTITRRLTKLSLRLKEMDAEIAHWEALLPLPAPDELKEVFDARRELAAATHLLGVLRSMRFHLEEVCVMAEEQARHTRSRAGSCQVYPGVERALRNLAAVLTRRGSAGGATPLRKAGAAPPSQGPRCEAPGDPG